MFLSANALSIVEKVEEKKTGVKGEEKGAAIHFLSVNGGVTEEPCSV